MKHEIHVSRRRVEPREGVQKEERQASCKCGWEGQIWYGTVSDYPGIELMLEAINHKTDVIMEHLQRAIIG